MDLRVIKTQKSIEAAFLRLAEQKALDEITVKELCQEAMINKATFYSHYDNMDALVNHMADNLIQQFINDVKLRDSLLQDPDQFMFDVMDRYAAYTLAGALLEGRYKAEFQVKANRALKEKLYRENPKYLEIDGIDITLDFILSGITGIAADFIHAAPQQQALIAKRVGKAIMAIQKSEESID